MYCGGYVDESMKPAQAHSFLEKTLCEVIYSKF